MTCKHGHPYTPENTRISQTGHRICRTCERLHKQAKREAAKAAKQAEEQSDGVRRCRICSWPLADLNTGVVCHHHAEWPGVERRVRIERG